MEWHENPKLDVAILVILLVGWFMGGILWFRPAILGLGWPAMLTWLLDFILWIGVPALTIVCCLWEEIKEL